MTSEAENPSADDFFSLAERLEYATSESLAPLAEECRQSSVAPETLALRKGLYRNVTDVEAVSEARGETHLRIHMRNGEKHPLNLPTRHVVELYKAIDSVQPEE